MKTKPFLVVLLLALSLFSQFCLADPLTGDQDVCAGESRYYYMDYSGTCTLEWGAGGDMVILDNLTIAVLWSSAGSKKVTVRATAGPGCTDSFYYELDITVNAVPGIPTVTSNNGNSEICNGDSFTYSATLSGYSTSYGYDWYSTGGLLINGSTYSIGFPLHTSTNSVTVTPGSAYNICGIYVRMNNGNGCPSQYGVLSRQVGPYNSDQFSINGSSFSCPGGNVNFSPSISGSDITGFQWNAPSDWNPNSSTSQNFSTSVPFSFSGGVVALRLQNRCGQTGSPATKYVAAGSCFRIMKPYPNPARKQIEIVAEEGEIEAESPQEAVLLGRDGRPVSKGTVEKGKLVLNVENVPAGLYFLRYWENGKPITKPWIIER